ncbi:hypothetical protein HOF92_12510 [bacterium]|jgi:tetratricopeptide (TPR) repeat protein|nr:hypothetical protein [bacterium]
MKCLHEFLLIYPGYLRIRLIPLLLLLLGFCGNFSAESLAQLQLMHQKKPKDPRVLYHLARGHLQSANFAKSLAFFQKLLEIVPDHPEALPGIAMSYWRLGKEYEAYSTCRPKSELAGCSRILTTIRDRRASRLPVFELRQTLESTMSLDLDRTEALLSKHSRDPLFLDTLALYFFENNLPEFAFDIWSLAPRLLDSRVRDFRKIANSYSDIITQRHRGRLGTDEGLFHAYYLWKFDPDSAERYPGLSLTEVLREFQKVVLRIGFDTFENYYRLGYLCCMAGSIDRCREAFIRADEKSPYELYSFILRKTLARLEVQPKAVNIGLAELEEFAPTSEDFQEFIRKEKIQEPLQDALAARDIPRTGDWYSPRSKEEFQEILEESSLPIYVEFCTSSHSRCKELQENILTKESLKGVLSGYTKVRLDPNLEPGKILRNSYPIKRLPQVYLLGKGGTLLAEFSGFFTPEQLRLRLVDSAR